MSVRIAWFAVVGVLMLTPGCGPNPLVEEVEGLRDEMCACKDQDCAEEVLKKLKEFDKRNKGKKVSRQDNDKMTEYYVKVSDCLGKISLQATPGPEGSAPPAKPEAAPAPEAKPSAAEPKPAAPE